MAEIWRFIDSAANTGAVNMAMDESLALAAEKEQFTPTLRVYRWQPYTISIGYHQKLEDLDTQKCRQDGIGLVKRPTGGRAILHAEEITYCVVLPASSPYYSDRILSSYKLLSDALVQGLMLLSPAIQFDQTEASAGPELKRGSINLPCFSTTIQHEIAARGKKLVGSAQRRYNNVLLQHGSILIGPEHLNLVNYFKFQDPEKKQVLKDYLIKRTTCLNELTGRQVTYSEVREAIQNGFESKLQVRLLAGQFTQTEIARCEKLMTKYKFD